MLFRLIQRARSTGGDKYECLDVDSDFRIYIPQEISRVNNQPLYEIELEITSTKLTANSETQYETPPAEEVTLSPEDQQFFKEINQLTPEQRQVMLQAYQDHLVL